MHELKTHDTHSTHTVLKRNYCAYQAREKKKIRSIYLTIEQK